ncbi:helix-turn-helix transcriptional regulator [Streptomyces sp. NPDC001276]|uniref:helix-turn-helix transcriptional regulator n=1 Tax=Streptomyces sp. NPDC001276 TaxID=3364555 RepID=UPI00368E227D
MSRRSLASLSDISEFTGLPRKTIYDQVHRRAGVGALAFKVGRHLRWDWADVDAWINQQKGQAAA